MHGLVGWDRPKRIEVDIDDKEPDNQGQGSQFSLEANSHKDNQSCAHNVLKNLRKGGRQERQHNVRGVLMQGQSTYMITAQWIPQRLAGLSTKHPNSCAHHLIMH